jgi:hypothetical protein
MMAKTYSSDELAYRAFLITIVGVGAFIAVVFLFIL